MCGHLFDFALRHLSAKCRKNPKGPCTYIVYTLALKHLYRDYFEAKVYTSWAYGPFRERDFQDMAHIATTITDLYRSGTWTLDSSVSMVRIL